MLLLPYKTDPCWVGCSVVRLLNVVVVCCSQLVDIFCICKYVDGDTTSTTTIVTAAAATYNNNKLANEQPILLVQQLLVG